MSSGTRQAHLPALDGHRRRETGTELQATLAELVDLSLSEAIRRLVVRTDNEDGAYMEPSGCNRGQPDLMERPPTAGLRSSRPSEGGAASRTALGDRRTSAQARRPFYIEGQGCAPRRCTTVASASATYVRNDGLPEVVWSTATFKLSLTVIGTPCSGATASPEPARVSGAASCTAAVDRSSTVRCREWKYRMRTT
jgi:hypothetical protein